MIERVFDFQIAAFLFVVESFILPNSRLSNKFPISHTTLKSLATSEMRGTSLLIIHSTKVIESVGDFCGFKHSNKFSRRTRISNQLLLIVFMILVMFPLLTRGSYLPECSEGASLASYEELGTISFYDATQGFNSVIELICTHVFPSFPYHHILS